jgi:hypothetical protein
MGCSWTASRSSAEAIDSLTSPICVASSNSLEQIRQKLEITGLLRRFGEYLFTATMVARGKPAPDLFLYAAQQVATAPARCLVEDSPAGIEAALAAGLTPIGFSGEAIAARSTELVSKSTERRWSFTTCTTWRQRWRSSLKPHRVIPLTSRHVRVPTMPVFRIDCLNAGSAKAPTATAIISGLRRGSQYGRPAMGAEIEGDGIPAIRLSTVGCGIAGHLDVIARKERGDPIGAACSPLACETMAQGDASRIA